MTKTSARKAFSDAQLFHLASLVQLSNRIVGAQDACLGSVKLGQSNPVIELAFQNRANLKIELRSHDYLAVVKSQATLPRAAVDQAAFNTFRNKDGVYTGSYDANAHRFSFESEDLKSLSYFVAAFAKAQRPDAAEHVTVQNAESAPAPSPALVRSEALAYAERDYNILQQQKRIVSGELVHIPGTDAYMTPETLAALKADLLEQGLVIRKPGSTKLPVEKIYLAEVVVGNKTITNSSTHFVEVVPARTRREARPTMVIEESANVSPTSHVNFEAAAKVPAARSLQPA